MHSWWESWTLLNYLHTAAAPCILRPSCSPHQCSQHCISTSLFHPTMLPPVGHPLHCLHMNPLSSPPSHAFSLTVHPNSQHPAHAHSTAPLLTAGLSHTAYLAVSLALLPCLLCTVQIRLSALNPHAFSSLGLNCQSPVCALPLLSAHLIVSLQFKRFGSSHCSQSNGPSSASCLQSPLSIPLFIS